MKRLAAVAWRVQRHRPWPRPKLGVIANVQAWRGPIHPATRRPRRRLGPRAAGPSEPVRCTILADPRVMDARQRVLCSVEELLSYQEELDHPTSWRRRYQRAVERQRWWSSTHPTPNEPYWQEAVVAGKCLLRTLSARDWADFDRPGHEEMVPDTDDAAKSGSGPHAGADLLLGTKEEEDELLYKELLEEDEINLSNSNAEELCQMLNEARTGSLALTTDEYNVLLLDALLGPSWSTDEILGVAMKIYRHMEDLDRIGSTASAPNNDTLEMLLLALSRRLLCFKTAFGLVQEQSTPSFMSRWNRFSISEAMLLCERLNEPAAAQTLLKHVQGDEDRKYRIPVQAYRSLIHLAKMNDEPERAIEALEAFLEASTKSVFARFL